MAAFFATLGAGRPAAPPDEPGDRRPAGDRAPAPAPRALRAGGERRRPPRRATAATSFAVPPPSRSTAAAATPGWRCRSSSTAATSRAGWSVRPSTRRSSRSSPSPRGPGSTRRRRGRCGWPRGQVRRSGSGSTSTSRTGVTTSIRSRPRDPMYALLGQLARDGAAGRRTFVDPARARYLFEQRDVLADDGRAITRAAATAAAGPDVVAAAPGPLLDRASLVASSFVNLFGRANAARIGRDDQASTAAAQLVGAHLYGVEHALAWHGPSDADRIAALPAAGRDEPAADTDGRRRRPRPPGRRDGTARRGLRSRRARRGARPRRPHRRRRRRPARRPRDLPARPRRRGRVPGRRRRRAAVPGGDLPRRRRCRTRHGWRAGSSSTSGTRRAGVAATATASGRSGSRRSARGSSGPAGCSVRPARRSSTPSRHPSRTSPIAS